MIEINAHTLKYVYFYAHILFAYYYEETHVNLNLMYYI